MKKYSLLILLACTLSFGMNAQTNSNKLGIGFNVNQHQNDFGVGLDFISPYFAKSKVAVKLGGNFKWLEHMDSLETTWTPYQNVQVGIRGRQFVLEEKLFVYGEGGLLFLFPDSKFSTDSNVMGGYGLFGIELRPVTSIGFYFEMGGVGTGATADKILTMPIYSNGFTTTAGFRINL